MNMPSSCSSNMLQIIHPDLCVPETSTLPLRTLRLLVTIGLLQHNGPQKLMLVSLLHCCPLLSYLLTTLPLHPHSLLSSMSSYHGGCRNYRYKHQLPIRIKNMLEAKHGEGEGVARIGTQKEAWAGSTYLCCWQEHLYNTTASTSIYISGGLSQCEFNTAPPYV